MLKEHASYPKVSIGIPTYNGNSSIVKTLYSIGEQQYPNLEIIISDNCSVDSTRELCLALSRKYPAIRYFRQPHNIGLVPNFDFVLKQATGDYFMWIADDDTLQPGILMQYVEFLTGHPEYSLVSGRVLYWDGDRPLFYEDGLGAEQASYRARVTRYYFKVVHGALYHGLMKRPLAAQIPLRKRIGDDWHFVATMAYMGKIKNLDCVGYNKQLGGCSKDFKLYARTVGDTWFSSEFPHIKIALDAFSEVLFLSPVYTAIPGYKRLMLAVLCCACILINYYCKEFPFIVGGRIKRYFLRLNGLLPFGGYGKIKDQTSMP